MASPGPQQRPGHGAEGAPAIGAQGLRRFLHRRADAFDHADQHQVGDRREGQGLHQQQAGEAVDPAARRDAEQVADEGGGDAAAPEQQDDAEADHERRRDDRQDGEQAQQPLGAEAGALVQQREAEAEQRGGDAAGHRQPQAVPEHAAIIPVGKAAERPDVLDRQALEQGGDRKAARAVDRRFQQHGGDRKEHEQQDRRDDDCDRSDQELIAAHRAAARHARRDQQQEDRACDQRAGAEPFLRRHRPEHRLKAGQGPAANADQEALQEQIEDPEHAAGEHQHPALAVAEQRGQRQRQCQDQRPQPAAVMKRGQEDGRRGARVRIGGEPAEAPEPALDRIPGQQDESGHARDEQREQGAILPCRCRHGRSNQRPAASLVAAGRVSRFRYWAPMSLSQRLSRRLRSSDEPYLAKS